MNLLPKNVRQNSSPAASICIADRLGNPQSQECHTCFSIVA